MPKMVYKVCPARDWSEAVTDRQYLGSADDHRDGFIHLSTATQLPGTLKRHYRDADGRGRTGLVLVVLDASRLGDALKWESARDGSLFPHLYGPLDPGLAVQSIPLDVGADGRHVLPGDLGPC